MSKLYYVSAIGCYDYSDSEKMSLEDAKAEMKKRYETCIEDIPNLVAWTKDGIEINDMSIEIGKDEFYQSWVIREAVEGDSIVDKLRRIVYMTEDCGREETKYQWTLEDATAGSLASEIGDIVKAIIDGIEKNAVEVRSVTSDETYMMTPDQILAAYRHQEHEFLANDARNHLNWFIYGDYYESPDDIDADEKAEIEADFLDKYHITVEDAFDIIEDFVAEFHDIFDANIDENTLWETAIENVLR